ncbi:MAG: hypothetical protein HY684_03130 [Chloroflexi bacterium]|nr:hypothetical protein [Chloroflexota bacterium]
MESQKHRVPEDIEAVFAYADEKGWTDGLPVVPPTPERVQAMLSTQDRAQDAVIGVLPPKRAEATVEKVAINAVMAGCKTEYFPVVVAAIEALAEPKFELYGVNTTTNPVAPLLIINGPIRQQLNINGSYHVLGPGWRANSTIGRAVSLCMKNIAGRIPGEVCMGTYKWPGALSAVIGEFEERSPWEPLSMERGFARGDSTVTVVSAIGSTNILDIESKESDDFLHTVAYSIVGIGSNNMFPFYGLGEMAVMLCPDHANLTAKKYTKQQAKEVLLEKTSRIPAWFFPKSRLERLRSEKAGQLQGDYVRLAERADQFIIIVAGGLGGYHSCFFPTFGDSYAVTKPIRTKKA